MNDRADITVPTAIPMPAQMEILKQLSPELHKRLLAIQRASPLALAGPLRILVAMAFQEGKSAQAKVNAETTTATTPAGDARTWTELASKLRREIETGAITGGDALPITRLAHDYGMGRGAVTRALRLLAEEGLVRHFRGTGYICIKGWPEARTAE